MKRRVNQLRGRKRRRSLFTEQLEDRRLLAALDLVPDPGAGTVNDVVGGPTVITVAPGTTVNVSAQAVSAENPVQGFQLNFENTAAELRVNNYSNGDLPLAVDSTMDSAATPADYFVASGVITALPVPPPRVLGTFDVTAPTAPGDYLVTADFTTGTAQTNTILSDGAGAALPITDFGDLIIRIEGAAPPEVTLGTATPAVNEDVGDVTLTVSLSEAATSEVSVPFTVTGTATDGTDYTITTSPVTIAAGVTSTDITLSVTDDAAEEPAETVIVTLGTPTGATLGATTAQTITIAASDAPVAASAALDLIPDGAAGTVTEENGNTVITVDPGTTVNVSAQVVSAQNPVQGFQLNFQNSSTDLLLNNYANGDLPLSVDGDLDSAATPADFFVASGVITALPVPPPRVLGTFDVTAPTAPGDYPVSADFTAGSPQTNTILSDANGAALAITDFGDLIIRIASTPPSVSLSAASQSVAESVGSVTVSVNLSESSTSNVSVPFTVTGTADDGTDFTITASPITIAAGTTSGDITLNINDDTADEPDETVVVTLGTPTGATLGSITAQTVTITDNDVTELPTVTVTVSPNSVEEDGNPNLIYRFTRSIAGATPLTVNYTTGGTATAGTDYTGTSNSVTIPANVMAASVVVNPTVDADVEPDETVVLTIAADSGYVIGAPSSATGTITNDDSVPTVSVTVAPSAVTEDGSDNLIYRFTRSVASSSPLTVNYSTNGTATPGTDYTGTDTSVTIPANILAASVVVNPTADFGVEPDETVVLTVSPNSGVYNIGSPSSATGTITNDDQTPTVSFTSSSQTAAEGTGTVTVTAALSAATNTAVTVPFTVSGTATDGNDFTITPSPLTISAGTTSASITISVVDDSIEEGNETIVVTLGTPTGADLGTSTVHTVTIPANDGVIDTDNRIIVPPSFVRPLQVIPGDGRPTAILFRAQSDTTLTIFRALVASATDEVTVLDRNLAPVTDSAPGNAFQGDLQAGSLYALMFNGHDSDAIYVIRSSAGFEALQGSSRTNILSRTDVNADGESTAGDALLVINQLQLARGAEGEAVRNDSQAGPYYDVNGDGVITALDALLVINSLRVEEARGEGEQVGSAITGQMKSRDVALMSHPVSRTVNTGKDDAGQIGKVVTGPDESRDIADIKSSSAAADVDDILSDENALDDVLTLLS